jgi:hypothetical protein
MEGDHKKYPAVLRGSLSRGFAVHVVHGHVGAGRRECDGDRLADAGIRTGDQGLLPFEKHRNRLRR